MRKTKSLVGRFPLVCLMVTIFWGRPITAAPGSCFVLKRIDPALWQEKTTAYTEGEVIGVEPGLCRLLEATGRRKSFRLRPTTKVYINGLPATPAAMRPVAPGAHFWAGVWSRNDEAVAVEAAYYGGELIVEAVASGKLQGWSPEEERTVFLLCREGIDLAEVTSGQIVYVLLDLDGRIRQVKILK